VGGSLLSVAGAVDAGGAISVLEAGGAACEHAAAISIAMATIMLNFFMRAPPEKHTCFFIISLSNSHGCQLVSTAAPGLCRLAAVARSYNFGLACSSCPYDCK
jgi:hypothetical protein